jgi:hypothetical protein
MAIKLIREPKKPAYDGGHSPFHSRHGRDVAGANPFHLTQSKFSLFVQERISPPGQRALDGGSLRFVSNCRASYEKSVTKTAYPFDGYRIGII